MSPLLWEFSAVGRLLASRNRSPKEGEPDSPSWMIHGQGRSASSNRGIRPHYAVLDLGTSKRERGEENQETRALGVVISSRAMLTGFTGRLIEPQPFMTMRASVDPGEHGTDGAVMASVSREQRGSGRPRDCGEILLLDVTAEGG